MGKSYTIVVTIFDGLQQLMYLRERLSIIMQQVDHTATKTIGLTNSLLVLLTTTVFTWLCIATRRRRLALPADDQAA
jgi:hypothetical protein